MASTYSTNLAIELIGTGDQAGTWGNTTNTNLGTLIEQAISGYVTQAVSTGTDTTITIPNGATGVARNMYIELTGTGGASTNLIVPANKKLYFIFNNTSSGQVTVKVSGQTGVSVPNKAKMVLVSNGTDIVDATNYMSNISAASANITVLTSASATITNLIATSASITTLTNNPTFSAGTANGVLYLNGSKVATSGSALTFTGTNLGIGTASAATPLEITSTTLNGIRMTLGSEARTHNISAVNNGRDLAILPFRNATLQSGNGTTEGVLTLNAYEYTVFGTGSSYTERMRLTDTGLGIGTSSPTTKLNVVGTSADNLTAQLAVGEASLATGKQLQLGYNTTASHGYIQAVHWGTGYKDLLLNPNGGNLGLGVTPSAWYTLSTVFQSNGYALEGRSGSPDYSAYWTNVYLNSAGSAFVYRGNGFATVYLQASGVHRWRTAASGTAGDTATFTELMTLDSSGRLGIGTTSPTEKLDVAAAGKIQVLRSDNARGGQFFADGTGTHLVALAAGNDPLYLEALGNSGDIRFTTSSSERARLTSGGYFVVNATTTVDTSMIGVAYDGINANGIGINDTASASGSGLIKFLTGGTVRGSITNNNNTGVLYNQTSDERLKKNIADADEFGSVIDAIQVRKFDWKENDYHTRAGFIAQELLAVAPEAVHQPNDKNEMMGVDYSKLVPMLVKEIQSLRARVAALEGA